MNYTTEYDAFASDHLRDAARRLNSLFQDPAASAADRQYAGAWYQEPTQKKSKS